MTLDFQDQVRFGYVEPDDADYLPMCPECGYEFPDHTPTESVQVDEDEWQLSWVCPDCGKTWDETEVYP